MMRRSVRAVVVVVVVLSLSELEGTSRTATAGSQHAVARKVHPGVRVQVRDHSFRRRRFADDARHGDDVTRQGFDASRFRCPLRGGNRPAVRR